MSPRNSPWKALFLSTSLIKEIYSNMAECEGCHTILDASSSLMWLLSYDLMHDLWFLLHLCSQKWWWWDTSLPGHFLEDAAYPTEYYWQNSVGCFGEGSIEASFDCIFFFSSSPYPFNSTRVYQQRRIVHILSSGTYSLSTFSIPNTVLNASRCLVHGRYKGRYLTITW